MYVRIYLRKKAAKTTFVRKTRAFNVDEIDTLKHTVFYNKKWKQAIDARKLKSFLSSANVGKN